MFEFVLVLLRVVFFNVYLRTLCHMECKKLGIKYPKLVIGRTNESNNLAFTRGNLVALDVTKQGLFELVSSLRHELRHQWQMVHYGDILDWTVENHLYGQYKGFYYYSLIEMDARYYARCKGKFMRGPIHEFSLRQLRQMYADGSYSAEMLKVSWRYGNP